MTPTAPSPVRTSSARRWIACPAPVRMLRWWWVTRLTMRLRPRARGCGRSGCSPAASHVMNYGRQARSPSIATSMTCFSATRRPRSRARGRPHGHDHGDRSRGGAAHHRLAGAASAQDLENEVGERRLAQDVHRLLPRRFAVASVRHPPGGAADYCLERGVAGARTCDPGDETALRVGQGWPLVESDDPCERFELLRVRCQPGHTGPGFIAVYCVARRFLA